MSSIPHTPRGTHSVSPEGERRFDGVTLPWTRWALGTRVVVRYRLPDGGLSDALGEVLETAVDGVLIATRRGPVRVRAADMVTGKTVPPPPAPRPGPPDGTARG
ncbi:putative acetyltransferase [Georgenia wangjunii]|uniref:putative acetyltransferase n=1 Tax=Georgenia wangjunii TaxID=3117730 RepID=UPI002F268A4A